MHKRTTQMALLTGVTDSMLFLSRVPVALRPPLSPGSTEQIDGCLSQWNHPNVHKALSQVPELALFY